MDHFRTSVHASGLFADAVLALLRLVDGALGAPDRIDLVDVGAGRGELLRAVVSRAGADLRDRLRPTAVEIADRPDELPPEIAWRPEVPPLSGLLLANEWLDDVPLDVVALTPAGPRLVLVGDDGTEFTGDPPTAADLAWLARWWPGDGTAEIGRTRDRAWESAVRQVRRGVAVAVDYAHERAARPTGGTRWPG